jgi:hypothetical protein
VNLEIIGAPALILIGSPNKRFADESTSKTSESSMPGASTLLDSSVLQEYDKTEIKKINNNELYKSFLCMLTSFENL